MQGIGAVLLAAGASERFGRANKLLAQVEGVPMLRRVADVLVAAGVREVVVVTGCECERYVAALAGLDLAFVHNADWDAGMGGSVATGVAALSSRCEAAFIVPGDMPRLTGQVLARLAHEFRTHGGDAVVVPVTRVGEQRNPVLWPRRSFAELAALRGPVGAKTLLASARRRIDVAFDDTDLFADVDTSAEYHMLTGRAPSEK